MAQGVMVRSVAAEARQGLAGTRTALVLALELGFHLLVELHRVVGFEPLDVDQLQVHLHGRAVSRRDLAAKLVRG